MKSVLGRCLILVSFLLTPVSAAPDSHNTPDCCITGHDPAAITTAQ